MKVSLVLMSHSELFCVFGTANCPVASSPALFVCSVAVYRCAACERNESAGMVQCLSEGWSCPHAKAACIHVNVKVPVKSCPTHLYLVA
jgi:hypothetical protein